MTKKNTEETEKKAKGTPRRRKTEIYGTVLKTFQTNFGLAILEDDYPKLAEKTGLALSTIKAWGAGSYLPQVDQLVLVARALNRDLDWLLEDHTFKGSKDAIVTYASAYQILRPLTAAGLIDEKTVPDYFISYMLHRSRELDKRKNLQQKTIDRWYNKLLTSFAVPVMRPLKDPEMYKMLEEEYGEINQDDTVVAVLHVVKDYYDGKNVDQVEKLYRQWIKKHNLAMPVLYENEEGDLEQYVNTNLIHEESDM